jgi:hypothetical protein
MIQGPPSAYGWYQVVQADGERCLLVRPPTKLYQGPQPIMLAICDEVEPWIRETGWGSEGAAMWQPEETTATIWGRDGQAHECRVVPSEYEPVMRFVPKAERG